MIERIFDCKSGWKKKGVKNSIRKNSVELQVLPFFSFLRSTQVTNRASGDVDDSGELPLVPQEVDS